MLSGSALLMWAMEHASKKKVLQSISAFIPDNSRNLFFQKIFNEKRGDKFQALCPPHYFFNKGAVHFAGDPEQMSAHGAFPTLSREEFGGIQEKFSDWFFPLDKDELLQDIERATVGCDLFSLWREVSLYCLVSNQQKKAKVENALKNLLQRNVQKRKKEERVQGLSHLLPLLGQELPFRSSGKSIKKNEGLFKWVIATHEHRKIYAFIVGYSDAKALCRISYEKEEYAYISLDLLEEVHENKIPASEPCRDVKSFFPEQFLEKYLLPVCRENSTVEYEPWLTAPFPLVWGFYFEEENRDLRTPVRFAEALACLLAPRDKIPELKEWLHGEGIDVPLYALEEE